MLSNLYVYNNARELVRRKGSSRLAGTGIGATVPFDGLHFVRISGTDYLIGAHGGNIENWLNGGNTVSGGVAAFTSGTPVGAAFVPNALYLGNGSQQNKRFNGSALATVMCSKPANTMSFSASGSGTLTGTYTYRVTFLSADGFDSQASDATIPIGVINVAQINLSVIPTAPAGEGCTGRRIWRTIGGGTTWYLIATIPENTSTTFSDTILDASVDTSVAVDLNAVRFPPCQVLASHSLRLAGILCDTAEGDRRTLYLSDYQAPWYCPEVVLLDEVDDPIQGARIALPESPVGLIGYGNVLVVFFPNQTWRLIGDNPNNWSFDRWLNIGCTSHYTARVYKGALLWLAADGVYALEGSEQGVQTLRISDDIREHLDALTAADFAAAHAFIWNDRYYLCFPGSAFYYDFKYKVWGEITNWLWDHSTVSENTGTSHEFIYAALHAAGQVWQLEVGTTDGGTAIPVRWKSGDHDMGQFGREKRIHRVICQFKVASGIATLNLYRGGGELLQAVTQDIALTDRPESNIITLDDHAVEGARDEYFAIEVLHEADSSDFRLLNAGVHWHLCT